MSGNHQPNPEDPQTPSTSEAEHPVESSQDDKKVPLGELVKQRQAAAEAKKAADAASERIKELEARLAESEKKPAKPEPAENPVEPDPRTSKLDEILRKDAIRDLRDQHGLTFAQAEKVHELASRLPDLDFDEVFAIAASRNVELFAEDGSAAAGFNPGVHGASRPGHGGQPVASNESDMQARVAHYQKLRATNKGAAQEVWNNMVGSIAAQQLGLPGHQKIKIPT